MAKSPATTKRGRKTFHPIAYRRQQEALEETATDNMGRLQKTNKKRNQQKRDGKYVKTLSELLPPSSSSSSSSSSSDESSSSSSSILTDQDGNDLIINNNIIIDKNNPHNNTAYLKQKYSENTLLDTTSYYDWTVKYRNQVEGHQNFMLYYPHWKKIYQDNWYYIQLLLARQTGKTTYNMGYLGYMGTTRPTSVTNYVTKDDLSLAAMSTRKYRYGVLKSNEIIMSLVRGKTELHKVEFLNDAMSNLGTHAHDFSQFVGKSGDAMLLDEGQDLNWAGHANLKETQAFTQGDTRITGVGGILETDYHAKWKSTDQREYHFDHNDDYIDSAGRIWPGQSWRKHLEFTHQRPLLDDNTEFVLPQSDLIFGPYLIKAMAGTWEATKPENSDKHGYHMTQFMMPNLALSVSDAKKIYHSNPEYSIEAKWDEYTPMERSMYILAEFTKGSQKPFTHESVRSCFVPGMHFTMPDDVDHSLGPVFAGTDWGAGNTAFTIVTIAQCIDISRQIFRVLYIEKIPKLNTDEDIAVYVMDILDRYKAQPMAMDGWGITHCVQRLEGYYGSRIRKTRYLKRPQIPIPTRHEYKILKRKNLFELDRSWAIEKIQNLIDEPAVIIDDSSSDDNTNSSSITIPRIQIPAEEPNLEFITDHLCSVFGEEIKINGQTYMDYDHPPSKPDDTLHSFIYVYVAYLLYTKYGSGGGGSRRGSASVSMEYERQSYFSDHGGGGGGGGDNISSSSSADSFRMNGHDNIY